MSRFIIHGGRPLSGRVTPAGNKNAALPMLAACVLTDEQVTLRNLPDIEDVRTMLALLDDLGVAISVSGSTVRLCAAGITKLSLAPALCRKVRSSILLAGPLAARHGRATLSPPGGDIIGRRRVDTHFLALQKLGIAIRGGRRFELRRKRLRGTAILLDEASVTATENAMMAASIAPGITVIHNAACEPHVQDLGQLLGKMGARLEGLGTNRITIRGVSRLGGASHRIDPDYVEAASYIAAAAATRGELRVSGVMPSMVLDVMSKGFARLGVRWKRTREGLTVPRCRDRLVQEDLGSAIPKIEDGTWPSFPSDLMSVAIVLATQARGSVLFFEKLFESRMYFVDSLISMGARMVQCDPHRVVVIGPSALHAAQFSTPDIRAGMALLIAALCAKGKSVIDNAEVIDRGYERIEEKLLSLGADITRVG